MIIPALQAIAISLSVFPAENKVPFPCSSKSKTDQEKEGRKIGIPYGSNCDTCPVRSLQIWLKESGIINGAFFRSVNRHGNLQKGRLSDKAVAIVVKRCAESTGLDASKYSGHSLRAGLATSAAAAGVSERAIMNQDRPQIPSYGQKVYQGRQSV